MSIKETVMMIKLESKSKKCTKEIKKRINRCYRRLQKRDLKFNYIKTSLKAH